MTDAVAAGVYVALAVACHVGFKAAARRGWIYWPGAARDALADRVGAHVSPPAVVLRDDQDASDALARLREVGTERPAYVYVVDAGGRLRGVVPALRLVGAVPDAGLGGLLERETVAVTEEDLLSDATMLLSAHRLRALPVVDATGRLLGVLARDRW